SLRESTARVESGRNVQKAPLGKPIHLELGIQERAQLEQQGIAVEGLAKKLPSPGLEGLDPLSAPRRPRRRDDNGSRRTYQLISAEAPTHVEPVHVGHLGIEDDDVWMVSQNRFYGLVRSVGPDHLKAVRGQDAFQRSGRPLLIVCDQYQRFAGLLGAAHLID